MRKYLHESSDSDADKLPLSEISDARDRLSRSSSQMLNANTPSELAIAQQSVKLTPTAKPAESTMSTPTDGAPATAASTTTAEVIDSITDNDTTVADMSGARPASTSSIDEPTSCSSSDSNFRASLADSTTAVTHTQHDDVNADVANKLRLPQASRPHPMHRTPARLLNCVHAQWGESEFSFAASRHLA